MKKIVLPSVIFGIVLALLVSASPVKAQTQPKTWPAGQYSGWVQFSGVVYTHLNQSSNGSQYSNSALTVYQSQGTMDVTVQSDGKATFSLRLPTDIAYQFHNQTTANGQSCRLNRYMGAQFEIFSIPASLNIDLSAGKFNTNLGSTNIISTVFRADAQGDLKGCQADTAKGFLAAYNPYLNKTTAALLTNGMEIDIDSQDENGASGRCLPLAWPSDAPQGNMKVRRDVQRCDWRVFKTTNPAPAAH
jgi:hypothetical protein